MNVTNQYRTYIDVQKIKRVAKRNKKLFFPTQTALDKTLNNNRLLKEKQRSVKKDQNLQAGFCEANFCNCEYTFAVGVS